MTEIQPVQTEVSYRQIINLAVPRSTPWKPQVAQQLMVNLFALPPLSLGIRATANHIQWYMETTTEQTEALVKAIYGLYPQTHLAVSPKMGNHVDYYLFDLHTAAPFVAPLKMAEDFKQLDPLTSFISALTDLAPDEVVVYELALVEPKAKYYELGEKLITQSTVNWWNFLHPGTAVVAATTKLAGADKVDKYVPEIQKPAQAKLNTPLKLVQFEIKIKTPSQERASTLIKQLFPTLAVFEQEGLNFLVAPHKKSFAPVLTPGEVAALWHLPSDQCQTSGVVWSGSAVAPIPGQLIDQTKGITLGTNRYQGRTHRVQLTYEDRVSHINLIGRTGVGKSTLLHQMAHQDIAQGKGVAVIDPRGDLVDAILATSIPPEREQEVVLFDTRDQEYPIGLNLLTRLPGVSEDATASYALAVMKKMFSDTWRGGRTETVLDAVLRTLVAVEGSTIQDIHRLLLDPKYRRQALDHVNDASTLDFWYDDYEMETPAQQKEFARPITYRIRKFYRDPTIRRIICQRQSLDVRDILNKGRIFLANLSGVADIEAETLGALLISKIQMAAFGRATVSPEKRTPFYLYVDEVQNFITTSLAQMFSEARKFGLSLVVANQYFRQLEGETLEALMGNVGTSIIFGVGPQDAQALSRHVKPQFMPEDLIKLNRFDTTVKMQLDGQTLPAFSMTTQPPLDRPEDAEERIARIKQHSQKTYAPRHRDEVDAEVKSRYDERQLGGDDGEQVEDEYFG